jgi:hypothetical protein
LPSAATTPASGGAVVGSMTRATPSIVRRSAAVVARSFCQDGSGMVSGRSTRPEIREPYSAELVMMSKPWKDSIWVPE